MVSRWPSTNPDLYPMPSTTKPKYDTVFPIVYKKKKKGKKEGSSVGFDRAVNPSLNHSPSPEERNGATAKRGQF